jgi:hypothetical protein
MPNRDTFRDLSFPNFSPTKTLWDYLLEDDMPKIMKPPKVGTDIYIDTAAYISHGRDDFQGGKCRVTKCYTRNGITWVEVLERPGHVYNWIFLEPVQKELKKEFGENRGHPDPDYHPNANKEW